MILGSLSFLLLLFLCLLVSSPQVFLGATGMIMVPSFSLKFTCPTLSSSFIELILYYFQCYNQPIKLTKGQTSNSLSLKIKIISQKKQFFLEYSNNLWTIIKIMNIEREGLPLIDPEKIDQEYKKQHQMQEKVEQLKGVSFKKFTIKKSKSVIHPPSIKKSSSIPKFTLKQEEKVQEHQTKPNITNIKFGQQMDNKQTEVKHNQSLKNLPAFSPSKVASQYRKTIFQLQTERKQLNIHPETSFKRTFSERIKETVPRDSQTILRKNSLFLVNCLKTRYRSTDKKAHIGDTNNVGNMRLGFFSEKSEGATHYQQRFQYMEEARQRLLMARNEAESKLSKMSSFHPEPW